MVLNSGKDNIMSLALVKLTKQRGNKTYEFFDYISAKVAKLGVEVQGSEHGHNEWSNAKIVKIFGDKEQESNHK